MDIRLILDFERPSDGAWNMAVDEALLESVATEGPAVRFYAWAVPTVSLGYFQTYDDRRRHAGSLGLPAVRRSTGGGAIVHDRELTYCWVFPTSLRRSATADYAAFHGTWMAALAEAGWVARLAGNEPPPAGPPAADGSTVSAGSSQPFLCFQRRTREDVLLGGYKILGSAQRRRAGAGLQHGSLLLAASSAAPELPGLSELTGRRWTTADTADRWRRAVGSSVGWRFQEAVCSPVVLRRAEAFVRERQTVREWVQKR